ncbi:seven transmembrane domain protein [Tieghemostelium lacteum]|uniref:Seven transmembrane domain protein n=1 Tax=Tieghemostelium lacteum TaxID=361077 RepID=A0A151Z6J5_TIELA|nr:seven transmembrane domain protein [Tieghemostelium lacteum]|eukprot:KYQ89580.1 seven transmembrane domain protein [Tieghemostelium lacteum]
MKRYNSVIVLLLFLFCQYCLGYKHHLSIENDIRPNFHIEGFGFGKGGVFQATITNWKINGEQLDLNDSAMVASVGFEIKVTKIEDNQNIEDFTYTNCSERLKAADYTIFYTGEITNKTIEIDGTDNIEGIYGLYYINCNPSATTTFNLVLEEYNVNSKGEISYLPIGLSPLPTVYVIFSIAFFALLAFWVLGFLRGGNLDGKRINRVHWLCAAYLLIQSISILFEGIEYHYIKTTGSPNGWNIAYYIFATLQGLFFIVLIALIGTGWYFIKPFLSDRDKTIFMIVIPLQILDNIALIMVDENSPGSIGWVSWYHLLTVVDILCCIAITCPIVWSIKHLRDGSQGDDKAAQNLQKLKLFRQFYLFVVFYLYFTRIIVILLKATLPFKLLWVGDFCLNLASVIFYAAVGYQFRPSADNPYFRLPTAEEEGVILAERDKELAEED